MMTLSVCSNCASCINQLLTSSVVKLVMCTSELQKHLKVSLLLVHQAGLHKLDWFTFISRRFLIQSDLQKRNKSKFDCLEGFWLAVQLPKCGQIYQQTTIGWCVGLEWPSTYFLMLKLVWFDGLERDLAFRRLGDQGSVLLTLLTQLAGFDCCRFHLILDHLVLRSSS